MIDKNTVTNPSDINELIVKFPTLLDIDKGDIIKNQNKKTINFLSNIGTNACIESLHAIKSLL